MSAQNPPCQTVTVPGLPCKIEVEGFSEQYLQHIKDHTYPKIWLGLPGFVLFAVGALTIVFGPSEIWYSRLTGPTFMQLIQMYPGPIATVGTLLCGLNAWLSKCALEGALLPDLYLLAHYTIEVDGEPLDLERVGFEHIDNQEFEFFELEEDADGAEMNEFAL